MVKCNGSEREDIKVLNNCLTCEHAQPHQKLGCEGKVIMCGIFIGVQCKPISTQN